MVPAAVLKRSGSACCQNFSEVFENFMMLVGILFADERFVDFNMIVWSMLEHHL